MTRRIFLVAPVIAFLFLNRKKDKEGHVVFEDGRFVWIDEGGTIPSGAAKRIREGGLPILSHFPDPDTGSHQVFPASLAKRRELKGWWGARFPNDPSICEIRFGDNLFRALFWLAGASG